MPRRLVRLFLAAALAGVVGGACAQEAVSVWAPRSGDAWVDAQLADINRYGSRYRDPFIDEMTRYQGAPRDLVGELLRRDWAPGDIYFACALAQVAGRPCREVAEAWERDPAQGWGAIARRMGIRPGSAEFHRLKRGIVPSFDRWGRPIELDASLAPDFPGRAASHGAHADDPETGAQGQGRGEHGRGGQRDAGHAPVGLPSPAGKDAPAHRGRGQNKGQAHGHG